MRVRIKCLFTVNLVAVIALACASFICGCGPGTEASNLRDKIAGTYTFSDGSGRVKIYNAGGSDICCDYEYPRGDAVAGSPNDTTHVIKRLNIDRTSNGVLYGTWDCNGVGTDGPGSIALLADRTVEIRMPGGADKLKPWY